MKFALLASAALLFAAPSFVFAADKEKDEEKKDSKETKSTSTLAEFKLGTHIGGRELADTKGKAVIIEFWGRNCGPCLAAMPHLNSLDRKYGKKGLVIVGAHAQDGTNEEILECAEKYKVKFAITTGAHSPISFSGIPRSFVFDASGNIVFDGNPHDGDFEKGVRKAMKTVTAAVSDDDGKSAAEDSESETKPASSTKPAGNTVLVPIRTWTNDDNKKMEAALISITGGTGTFKFKNGKTFTYAIDKLSEDDRKVIDEAKAETPAE